MATAYAAKTISPKQSAYIASLLELRTVPRILTLQFTEDMTSKAASDLIDELTKCPWKNAKPQVKKGEPVGEGFYCITEGLCDLVYYKVQTSKTSGKRYAKTWNGKGWDFAPGGIYKLTDADKLTKEQAVKFGKKTGNCCICSKVLTVKASIEAGIGPICADKLGW
jgi:hypothetical protein